MRERIWDAPWLQTISQIFGKNPVYAVGGAVRNTLMGLPVHDMDLCGPVRPDQVMELCEGTPVHARLRAAHFGTVELHIDGQMAEYTTFRQDSYRNGHKPSAVHFADTVEVDALRRDFSVNALYLPPGEHAEIIDPTGGLKHLQQKILHTVTEDPDQVLKDDGLRILRAARFQAELGLTPTEAVMQSAYKYRGLLYDIAPERKRVELDRLLLSDVKYSMLSRSVPPVSSGLNTLQRIGVWPMLFGARPSCKAEDMDQTAALPLTAKLVVLFYQEAPAVLEAQMEALRYAKRDIKLASQMLAATRELIADHLSLNDALEYGMPVLHEVQKIVTVLAATANIDQAALERIKTILRTIQSRKPPLGIKDLHIGGEALLMLCREYQVPQQYIGKTLHALWIEAVNERVDNTQEALEECARRLLIDFKGCG